MRIQKPCLPIGMCTRAGHCRLTFREGSRGRRPDVPLKRKQSVTNGFRWPRSRKTGL